MSSLRKSPFKFLDAFEPEDADLYFGREREVDELYELTYQCRLIVFFGASGTGKTSLVQCGLANRFPSTRWREVYVRRDRDINAALLGRINKELQALGQPAAEDALEGLTQLYDATLTPLYLTLDQLEELFILQPSPEEQEQFFDFLQAFLGAPLEAKIILVIREEFIGHLWDWEHLVPSLFDFRYRIRHMEKEDTKQVITRTLRTLHQRGDIQTPDPASTAEEVYTKLNEQAAGSQLTYVQVMLDQLYRDAAREGDLPPLIDSTLVQNMEGDVFDRLIDDQLRTLEQELGPGYEGIPLRVLAEFISGEKTKKILPEEKLAEIQQKYALTAKQLNRLIEVFENMRILKRYES